jgi:RNA polymerase sigma-70 factor (ECF subfamily)
MRPRSMRSRRASIRNSTDWPWISCSGSAKNPHEVYLKLIDVQKVELDGKAHFFAICAQMMRRILVDAARKRATSRHGGRLSRIQLDDVAHLNLGQENDKRLMALNDALDELAKDDPRRAKVVELRYFGGLSVPDTAAVLKVSVETVTRDWRLARGWLLLQIKHANRPGASSPLD